MSGAMSSRPRLSVVIPTHNQCQRLRLVLCGLAAQTLPASAYEVLVVDDRCTDQTAAVLAEAQGQLPLRVLQSSDKGGRNRARNAGIEAARGEGVVFLDGDALPEPDLLRQYDMAFAKGADVLCGFMYCLPGLEHFADPQTAELPGALAGLFAERCRALAVTPERICRDFDGIRAQAVEGGYPLAASALRQRQYLQLHAAQPRSAAGFLGFVPHNGGVRRRLLTAVGGFDPEISFCEGWDLAYRLQRQGHWTQPLAAATYHLYHHHPFDDPQKARQQGQWRYDAVEHMARRYDDDRLRLLYGWFAALWPDPMFPDECLVPDLQEWARRYDGMTASLWAQYRAVLERHPVLPVLSLPSIPSSNTEVCHA